MIHAFIAFALTMSISSAQADYETGLPANELGKIMVLMYHKIGYPEATWCRTPENFRKDLQALFEQGYYLINTADLINGTMKVPAGKSPVVLTFDDTASGQIEKKNGIWDPDSAVGIINSMYDRHPDFGRAGSFYLNKKSEDPAKKGSHPGLSAMLREMVDLGYELGNHTYDHPKLNGLTQPEVVKEIASLQHWIETIVPGYKIRTMAMPHGIYPKEESWATDGEYQGTRYHHEILLKVGSEPSVSPYSKFFRPNRVSRVRGSDLFDHPSEATTTSYLPGAIAFFNQHTYARFVSDGDVETITVPAQRESELNPAAKAKAAKFIH